MATVQMYVLCVHIGRSVHAAAETRVLLVVRTVAAGRHQYSDDDDDDDDGYNECSHGGQTLPRSDQSVLDTSSDHLRHIVAIREGRKRKET